MCVCVCVCVWLATETCTTYSNMFANTHDDYNIQGQVLQNNTVGLWWRQKRILTDGPHAALQTSAKATADELAPYQRCPVIASAQTLRLAELYPRRQVGSCHPRLARVLDRDNRGKGSAHAPSRPLAAMLKGCGRCRPPLLPTENSADMSTFTDTQ